MLRQDDNGSVGTLMECPNCGNYGWHGQARVDEDQHFQCADCSAGFTYSP